MMWLEEEIIVFNYCQTSVLSLSMVGSLVDHRVYKPYTLVGPPALWLVIAPLAVYSSTTDYICGVVYSVEYFSYIIQTPKTLTVI